MATRKPSDVWKFYEKKEGKAKCLLCTKELIYSGGTSNLRDHLNRMHQNEYHPLKSAQVTIDRAFTTVRSTCSEARSKRISELIVEMIALDMRPSRMVECQGFRKMMAFVEPGYSCPSATHISSIVGRRHALLVQKLKQKIAAEASYLSLTSDIWTSKANDAYVTVTCHYISPQWKMETLVLSTQGFQEQHTGVNIASALVEIATKFNIEDKIVAVVHDQGSNYVRAVDILAESHGWDEVKCAGHCLQLCVNSGLALAPIARMIAVARKIVGHFRHSALATGALQSVKK